MAGEPQVVPRKLVVVEQVDFIEPAWTPAETAAFLGVSRRQLKELPLRPMRVTARTFRYRPEAVRAFARSLEGEL